MKPSEIQSDEVKKLIMTCDKIGEGMQMQATEINVIRNALCLLLGDFDQNTLNYLLSKMIKMVGVNLPSPEPQKKIGFGA